MSIGPELIDEYTTDCDLQNYDYLFQRKRPRVNRKAAKFNNYFNDEGYLPTLLQLVQDGQNLPFEFNMTGWVRRDD